MIRVGSGEEAETFSSFYLSQGRTVPISGGITFQVLEIQPGGTMCWPADESWARLCSAARGIIRIKLPDGEFPIEPNGVWTVKQGLDCSMVSPCHLGTVAHVTTFGDD
ncbi:hypothetical protein VTI74DRAFT_11025 [Chaetomium olivicolor]